MSNYLHSVALTGLVVWGALCLTAPAQSPVHYFQSADQPPGSIGSSQLLRGGPLAGYYQPVKIDVPPGASVALAEEGGFSSDKKDFALAGMLIGKVYRLKVTGIPDRPGEEVFPTLEIINRLYPPCGYEVHYPIPIDIAPEDIEIALSGQFVTRVIYLEAPEAAFPVAEDPEHQRYFEVPAASDPLKVADELGRPMAILRIGSRQPEADGPSSTFLYGSPPLLWLPPPKGRPRIPAKVEPIRHGRDIPRKPGHGPQTTRRAVPQGPYYR